MGKGLTALYQNSQKYPQCPRIYLPNLSVQAQKFKISIKKALSGVCSLWVNWSAKFQGGLAIPPRPPVTIFIFARLRGNLNSEATSKSLFILPYYGKFKAKATAEDQNHDSFLKN